MKKKNEKWSQVSKIKLENFVIQFKEDGYRKVVEITIIGGNWKMVFYEDSLMYARLTALIKFEAEEYLKSWLFSVYTLANNLPDWEFFEKYLSAFSAMQERYRLMQKQSSEEDDAKALEEVSAMEELGGMMEQVGQEEIFEE